MSQRHEASIITAAVTALADFKNTTPSLWRSNNGSLRQRLQMVQLCAATGKGVTTIIGDAAGTITVSTKFG